MIAHATVSEAYDGLGNLLTRTLGAGTANARSFTNSYDSLNRLILSQDSLPTSLGGRGSRGVAYDARGNMTQIGSQALAYSFDGQISSLGGAAPGLGNTAGFNVYDAENRRVRSHVNGRETIYIYDHSGRLLLSRKLHDGEPVERLYLESGQALAKWTGTALTYLHTDHLGTPIRGTHGLGTQDNGNGLPAAVGEEIFHDVSTPFGLQPTSGWHGTGSSGFDPMTGVGSNCGVTGFTTHAKDCETGLQYMQARHYDPGLVRFTSGDPVTFMDKPYPGQVNRYAYTWNNPVNANDPDGEFLNFVAKFIVDVGLEVAIQVASGEGINLGSAAKGAALGVLDPTKTARKAVKLAKLAKAANKTCCFVAGTLVETKDGLRPIEDIEVGDLVWARDEETGEEALKPVLGLIRLHDRVIWDLETVSETGEVHTFGTTDDHPWWVDGHGWKRTDELSPKDILVTQTGEKVSILSVTNTNVIKPTYNFEVADFNTYFVGESKVWVHNAACDLGSAAGSRAGKKHTRAAVRDEIAANAKANGGTTQCVTCKVNTTPTTRRTKGSTVAPTEGQGAHIKARANGGNGATVGDRSNVAIQCASCNNKTRTNDVEFN